MPIREYINTTGVGWIIALIVFILAVVAIFGGIHATPEFVLVEIAGCALSRLI